MPLSPDAKPKLGSEPACLSDVGDLDGLEVLGESVASDVEGEGADGGEAPGQAGGVHVAAHAAVAVAVDLGVAIQSCSVIVR